MQVELFSAQMFDWGFVHCDPHPGNIIIRARPGSSLSSKSSSTSVLREPQLVLRLAWYSEPVIHPRHSKILHPPNRKAKSGLTGLLSTSGNQINVRCQVSLSHVINLITFFKIPFHSEGSGNGSQHSSFLVRSVARHILSPAIFKLIHLR